MMKAWQWVGWWAITLLVLAVLVRAQDGGVQQYESVNGAVRYELPLGWELQNEWYRQGEQYKSIWRWGQMPPDLSNTYISVIHNDPINMEVQLVNVQNLGRFEYEGKPDVLELLSALVFEANYFFEVERVSIITQGRGIERVTSRFMNDAYDILQETWYVYSLNDQWYVVVRLQQRNVQQLSIEQAEQHILQILDNVRFNANADRNGWAYAATPYNSDVLATVELLRLRTQDAMYPVLDYNRYINRKIGFASVFGRRYVREHADEYGAYMYRVEWVWHYEDARYFPDPNILLTVMQPWHPDIEAAPDSNTPQEYLRSLRLTRNGYVTLHRFQGLNIVQVSGDRQLTLAYALDDLWIVQITANIPAYLHDELLPEMLVMLPTVQIHNISSVRSVQGSVVGDIPIPRSFEFTGKSTFNEQGEHKFYMHHVIRRSNVMIQIHLVPSLLHSGDIRAVSSVLTDSANYYPPQSLLYSLNGQLMLRGTGYGNSDFPNGVVLLDRFVQQGWVVSIYGDSDDGRGMRTLRDAMEVIAANLQLDPAPPAN